MLGFFTAVMCLGGAVFSRVFSSATALFEVPNVPPCAVAMHMLLSKSTTTGIKSVCGCNSATVSPPIASQLAQLEEPHEKAESATVMNVLYYVGITIASTLAIALHYVHD